MLLEGHSTRSCCRTSWLRLSVTAGTRNVLSLRECEMWARAGERGPGRRRGQGAHPWARSSWAKWSASSTGRRRRGVRPPGHRRAGQCSTTAACGPGRGAGPGPGWGPSKRRKASQRCSRTSSPAAVCRQPRTASTPGPPSAVTAATTSEGTYELERWSAHRPAPPPRRGLLPAYRPAPRRRRPRAQPAAPGSRGAAGCGRCSPSPREMRAAPAPRSAPGASPPASAAPRPSP